MNNCCRIFILSIPVCLMLGTLYFANYEVLTLSIDEHNKYDKYDSKNDYLIDCLREFNCTFSNMNPFCKSILKFHCNDYVTIGNVILWWILFVIVSIISILSTILFIIGIIVQIERLNNLNYE